MEQRKLLKDKEEDTPEEPWMKEIKEERVKIFTQEELSEGVKNYLRASYPPVSYWRDDLFPTPNKDVP